MRIIFFQPNNRLFRHDGAEFTARAKDCRDFWTGQGHDVKMCPLPKANDAGKRAFVRGVLDVQAEKSVDRIAVFGHGTQGWCDLGMTVAIIKQSTDPVTLKTVVFSGSQSSFVDSFERALTPDARIGLYCCLTGHNVVNGLAVSLSEVLPGVVIMANKSSSPWAILGGHTTDNPYKRMFIDGEYRDLWPTDKAEFKVWREKLKESKAFEYELLEADVLKAWVQG